MRNELTRPEEILEELADKVAANITRLAPVSFDRTFREMTRYHRFLLALGEARAADGKAFNYAEVAGGSWTAPHQDWISQYRRLIERAADQLADDPHFIRNLAYAPRRLLSQSGDSELSPTVVCAILDLGPILVNRLEAWVTRRTIVETREGQSAGPRLMLAGSDAKAYANVLTDIVGAWESLLYHPSISSEQSDGDEQSAPARWVANRSSWAFLWQHLTNTARCLAIAVWNEDEIGADLFREALVRWPQALDHHMDHDAELRHRRLLFPNLLDLDWAEAEAAAALLARDYNPPPGPEQLFISMVSCARDDVILLTAAVLISWTMNEKQSSDIGARTARALMHREVDDSHLLRRGRHGSRFRSLFLDLLRFDMAGGRHQDGSYGAKLDGLVAALDNMTERRVVPGRVFTPSTMHGLQNLLLPQIAMLLVYVPKEGDDGLLDRIDALAREEDVLPKRDESLRDSLRYLEQIQSTLNDPPASLVNAVSAWAPDHDTELNKERLREIVAGATAAIEAQRQQRLEAREPDSAKLERIRAAIEAALLTEAPEAHFFRGVEVGPCSEDQAADLREFRFTGISKAQLVEPPMESEVSGFEDWLVKRSRQKAGSMAWYAFCERPKTEIAVTAGPDDGAFWREVAPLAQEVGSDTVLVVSTKAEGAALMRMLDAREADRPKLQIKQRPRDERPRYYIATIEGVDIFRADFPAGEAWLFSARNLLAVRYAQTEPSGRYVSLEFELGEDLQGALRVGVRQHLLWSDSPAFVLKGPNFGNDTAAPNR